MVQKYLLDKAMKGTANFEVKVPVNGGIWSVPEYKVYGRIALGGTVTVYDGSEMHRGEVVYIHPQGRFFKYRQMGKRGGRRSRSRQRKEKVKAWQERRKSSRLTS